jgi:hypothetical protein
MNPFLASFARWLVAPWLLRPSNGQQLRTAFDAVDGASLGIVHDKITSIAISILQSRWARVLASEHSI